MSDIENEQVPLLKEKKPRKPRTKKEIVINLVNQEPQPIDQLPEPVIEQKEEEYLDTIIPPIKEKKQKTEKQMAAFQKMAEARKKKIEDKKLEDKIDAAKLLLENGESVTPNKRGSKAKKVIVQDDDEQDVEVIYVKPKKARKKKIIVEEEETEEETVSDTEEHIPTKMKSHQNKKSIKNKEIYPVTMRKAPTVVFMD